MVSPATACVQASVVIAAVLVVRACLAKKAPPAVFVTCWWLVLLRALVPFFPEHQAKEVIDASDWAAQLSQRPGTALFSPASSDVAPVWQGAAGTMGLIDALAGLWAVVAATLCILLAVMYAHDRFMLFHAGFDVTDDFAGQVCRFQTPMLRRGVRIVEVDGLPTPVSYGVFRPTIAIPAGFRLSVTKDQLNVVLCHEFSHIRRLDTLVKPLAALMVCLYWFDPLMWLAFFAMQTDMEKASDAWALRGRSRKEKAMYARTLLEAKTASGALCAFGCPPIEKRIKAVLAPKPSLLACICACLLVLTCCFSSLAFAAVTFPADADQPTMTVRNGNYSFDIPEYWQGRVSVAVDGDSTYVYPTGYPSLPLVTITVASPGDELFENIGNPILFATEYGDGKYLAVQAINYLWMSAGSAWYNTWRYYPLTGANPEYPGEEGEELVVDLSTNGRYTAAEAREMERVNGDNAVYAAQGGNRGAKDLVATIVVDLPDGTVYGPILPD